MKSHKTQKEKLKICENHLFILKRKEEKRCRIKNDLKPPQLNERMRKKVSREFSKYA